MYNEDLCHYQAFTRPRDNAKPLTFKMNAIYKYISTNYSLKPIMAFGGVFSILLVINYWSLMRFPAPFVDEAWVAARAWTMIKNGQAFGPLDYGVFDNFDGFWTFFPWLPTVFESWGLRWFTEPNLFGIRFVSLVSGFILISAVYVIGFYFGGNQLGMLSAFLTGTSLPFLYSAHLGRYDIFTATLGFLSIATHLLNHSQRIWLSVLTGIFAGLSFETHSNGAIFIPIIPLLIFTDHKSRILINKVFWGFVAGLTSGIGFYLYRHVYFFPAEFFAFTRIVYGPTHTPPLFTLDIWIMLDGIWKTAKLVLATYPAIVILIPWVIYLLFMRNSRKDQKPLIILGVLFTGHSLLIRNKHLYYAILLTPIIDINISAFAIDHVQHMKTKRLLYIIGKAIILGVILGTIIINLRYLSVNLMNNYRNVQSQIAKVIEPGQSIMGSQTYWFDFYEHPYSSWENLIYYQRYFPGTNLEDALENFQPDILIFDRNWNYFIFNEQIGDIYQQNLQISKTRMDAFLMKHGEQALSIEDAYYGKVKVYKLTW